MKQSKIEKIKVNLSIAGFGAIIGLVVALLSYWKMMVMNTTCKVSGADGFVCDAAAYVANHPANYALGVIGAGAALMLIYVSFMTRGR